MTKKRGSTPTRRKIDSPKEDVTAYLQSKGADEAAEYARRGRRYANLNQIELTELWKQSFRAMANNYGDTVARSDQSDFVAEFTLRGGEPPYHEVKEDFDRLIQAAQKATDYLNANPDEMDRIGTELMADLEEFKSRKSSSGN
jgi:hypothetical protein